MSACRALALLGAAALVLVACGVSAPAPGPPAPAPPAAAKARVFVLSNSSPQVTVIDGETHKILRTADVPGIKSWTWNDDNNYSDGAEIWLGARDPDTSEAEVITLNLSTLEVTARIPLGKEATTLYIGKPTKDGQLYVAKHASWQMAIIDIKAKKLLRAIDVPTNAGTSGTPPRWAVCDSDATTGPDGVERVYYPTSWGTTTVALDAKTGQPLRTLEHPAGSRPCMLTLSPDKKVWVQECDGNALAVLDPVSLEVLKRIPTAKYPIVASFSPDGTLAYTGHGSDTVVGVYDAKTFAEIARVQVGTNPDKVAAHPNGRWLYAEVSKEASVAVIDTTSWTVAERLPIGTNPTSVFVQVLR
jgi:YVTN family beta-propeller protein